MSLPDITPTAVVTPADVSAVLDGLAPGKYLTRDLHRRYTALMTEQGRGAANVQAFGIAMQSSGATWRKSHGVGSWIVGAH